MYFSNHIALRGMTDSNKMAVAVMQGVSKLKTDGNKVETSLHDTIYAGKTAYMEGAAIDGSPQLGRYKCCSYVGVVLIHSVMSVRQS